MNLSKFGKKFTGVSGINELMIDLADAMSNNTEMLMLGGGAPAHINEIDAMLRRRMNDILNNKREYEAMVGDYNGPAGNTEFIQALAELFSREFGFDIKPENIALTN